MNTKRYYSKNKPNLSLLLLSLSLFLMALVGVVLLLVNNNIIASREVTYAFVFFYIVLVLLIGQNELRQLIVSKRIALSVYLIGHLFWFVLPVIQSVMGTREWYGTRTYYFPISDNDVLIATVYISFFLCSTIITYWLSENLLSKNKKNDSNVHLQKKNSLNSMTLFVICMGLFLIGLLPFIIYGGGGDQILQGIASSRSIEKAWSQAAFESNPIAVIGRASLVSVGAVAFTYLLITKNRIYQLTMLTIFFVAFTVTYFDSGTRTWTLLIIFPPVLVWFINRLHTKSLSKITIIILIIFLVSVLFLVQLQGRMRHSGFFQKDTSSRQSGVTIRSDDNDFFVETVIAVSAFPNHFDYVHESNWFLFLINPIPRSLWAEKPYPQVIRQYSFARDGYDIYFLTGVSRMPSIVGQYYISWGTIGVLLISITWGGVLAWIDSQFKRKELTWLTYLWLGIFSMWIFVGFRGIFPGFHYPLIIIGIIVIFERQISKNNPVRLYTVNYSEKRQTVYHNENRH